MRDTRLATGTRKLIKRWMYAQLSILDGVMILLGKKNPKLSFTVLGDPNSWVRRRPEWTPGTDQLLRAGDNRDPGDWTLASIIRLSGLPVSAGDF